MKKVQTIAVLIGAVLALAGCGAEPTHVEGQEKKDMQEWLQHGIPASKSPGASAKPAASSTPLGQPTDK